jgi:hypothetical protein
LLQFSFPMQSKQVVVGATDDQITHKNDREQ